MVTTVVESVQSDLDAWEARLPGVSKSALAALALKLAEHLDNPRTQATAAANAGNSLDRVLERIVAQLPADAETDALDELRQRRAKRRAG